MNRVDGLLPAHLIGIIRSIDLAEQRAAAEAPNLIEDPTLHAGAPTLRRAQRIYAGWSLIGIPILGAIGSTLALAVLVWHSSAEFRLIVTALACLVLALAIFFAFTFPANQVTENWTARPADWETLRSQWEYSHAVGALLYLTALIALTLSLIVRGNRAENPGVRRDVDVG